MEWTTLIFFYVAPFVKMVSIEMREVYILLQKDFCNMYLIVNGYNCFAQLVGKWACLCLSIHQWFLTIIWKWYDWPGASEFTQNNIFNSLGLSDAIWQQQTSVNIGSGNG